MDPKALWSGKLKSFLPGFLAAHPVLAGFAERGSVILHGSTCRGMDDAFSDLDLYFMLSEGDLAQFDRCSPTRFLEFQLDGKPGHLNASSVEAFTARIDGCDMPHISELRTGVLVNGRSVAVENLLATARQPMRDEVRNAFFFYHYFQMRNFHRSADNPMERGDGVAVMLSVSHTVAHALRAALVLDGEPYPYEKWLRREAATYPTGAALMPALNSLLDAVANDALRQPGEARNPISLALRQMRTVLIDAARSRGIDEPWLTHWWLYLNQGESATVGVRWGD